MAYVRTRNGLYLLKQRTFDKSLDHYGIGVAGFQVWKLGVGTWRPVVVHLVPPSIRTDLWEDSGPWEILVQIKDEVGALRRLVAACQRPEYDLFGNNCEHFARYVAAGKRESRQLQGVVTFVGVTALAVWALRSQR